MSAMHGSRPGRLHPLVLGAAAAAILAALGTLERATTPATAAVVGPAQARGAAGEPAPLGALCGPRTIPDGEACVPLPAPGAPIEERGELRAAKGAHPSAQSRAEIYDQIPRLPERPADHEAYLYPIGSAEAPPRLLSGYDLDRPAPEQRQGAAFHETGHGGLDLAGNRGDPVRLIALEHQEGNVEVAFVGELFGITVVTSHMLQEAGRLRQYVVLHGHLDRPGPGIVPGAKVAPGDTIGFVGDSGSPGIVHLHLEVRQVREGVNLAAIELGRLADNATSVPCDPRNVLPLAP